jgi:hypothetical protein
MIRWFIAARRKEGLTIDYFRNYYETRHAPLVVKLLPRVEMYERNYVVPETLIGGSGVETPTFAYDVISEMQFRDQASFDDLLCEAGRPDIKAALAEDEENFMDRSSISIFVVDTQQSNIGDAAIAFPVR